MDARLHAAATGAIALIAAASIAAQSEPFRDDLLRRTLRFSAADFRALDAGTAVVKSLATPVRQEIAHFGVVHIEAPPTQFIERFRAIERFESGPNIPQIGRFGANPRIEELEGLTLPAADIEALQECRAGDCNLKLTGAAMARFRSEVDWSSPNATARATEIARQMLLDLVRRYQATGNQALGHYEDHAETLRVAEQFHALLAEDDLLPAKVPALMAYLRDYPRNRPDGADDIFYWSVVDFGLKPTIRLNHVTIYPLSGQSSDVSYAIAIKQLYAAHYFQTALELRFLVGDRRRGRAGFYLVSITRSRADGMTGLTGPLMRSIVNRRSRNAVRVYLEHIKQQVEREKPL